jgi:ATP/ADP translocase
MLPSTETCARWKNKKFVRQPHRMIIGFLVSVCVLFYSIFSGQYGAAQMFGAIALIFLFFYVLANFIVWRARDIEVD